jgi:hypothetical protein
MTGLRRHRFPLTKKRPAIHRLQDQAAQAEFHLEFPVDPVAQAGRQPLGILSVEFRAPHHGWEEHRVPLEFQGCLPEVLAEDSEVGHPLLAESQACLSVV